MPASGTLEKTVVVHAWLLKRAGTVQPSISSLGGEPGGANKAMCARDGCAVKTGHQYCVPSRSRPPQQYSKIVGKVFLYTVAAVGHFGACAV